MRTLFCAAILAGYLALAASPTSAMTGAGGASLSQAVRTNFEQVVVRRGRGARRSVNINRSRNVTRTRNVNRTVNINRNVRVNRTVVRPGWRGGGTRWVRPAHYWWRPGGAMAAGAAIGFVTAATAVAWAGAPPAPNYCWYYTDQNRTTGFWDVCP